MPEQIQEVVATGMTPGDEKGRQYLARCGPTYLTDRAGTVMVDSFPSIEALRSQLSPVATTTQAHPVAGIELLVLAVPIVTPSRTAFLAGKNKLIAGATIRQLRLALHRLTSA